MYEVLVIGAGPAGALAAKTCAESGLRVAIVEKAKIPRPKTCGGGVSLKALKLIGTPVPEDIVGQRIEGYRFFSPEFRSIEFGSTETLAISTSREQFDAFLTGLATEQGCTLFDGDPVVDIKIANDGIVCKLASGKVLKGSILVGADGVNSITARISGIRERWESDQVGLCLESTVDVGSDDLGEIVDPEIFELYFLNLPFGYGWVFPKRSSISVGVGGRLSDIKQPQKMLMDFCTQVSELKGRDIGVSRYHAHLVPAGGFRRKYVSDRVLLVGDAAGFVDPLTGEGIYYAMKSGIIAAETCVDALNSDRYGAAFLESGFCGACESAFGRDLETALSLTYKVHGNLDLFFSFLEDRAGEIGPALVKGEKNYGMIQRELILGFPRLLLRASSKLISKKLRRML